MASLLAMLFLILFTTLSVGFYSSTTTAVQVSSNDQRCVDALTAAESGMNFMRYQLANVSIPPGTPEDELATELYDDLDASMDETGNLATQSLSMAGNVIYVPENGYINLGSHGSFRAVVTVWPDGIVIRSEGRSVSNTVALSEGVMVRAITMQYTRSAKPSNVFDFAVASKGQIVMKKGSITTDRDNHVPTPTTILSALDEGLSLVVSGGIIGGKLTMLDTAQISVTGGSVAGSSMPSYIQSALVNRIPDAPEFPTLDPTIYKAYATLAYTGPKAGTKVSRNIRIPAGTGTPQNPVRFNANDELQGILYIESPNAVRFNGNFKLNGFIVMETGTSMINTNSLDFRGNVTMGAVPNGNQFDALRAATGVAIMAPSASVTMSGSTDSSVKGSIIVNTFSFAGSADLKIDQGTLMTYHEGVNSAQFNGKTVKFTSTGSSNVPTQGLTFSSYYQPQPATYAELME